jgi:hypothetical protein
MRTTRLHISPEVVVKGIRKCCMSDVVAGTDGVMLWNGIEGVGSVRGECVGDGGTDCEGGESDSEW